MTATPSHAGVDAAGTGWAGDLNLAVRLALREMRGGLKGFFVFLACIAIGTAAIGAVNSVARSVTDGISGQGRIILGGDLRFEMVHRLASDAENAFLQSLGKNALHASLRSMARLPDGSDQALVEVKAVDAAYPLYGALETTPSLSHDQLFDRTGTEFGAAAPAALLDRLGLEIGDRVAMGEQNFQIRAEILREPDQLSDGFGFAPRLMVSMEGLKSAGLVQPGSLVDYVYRVALDESGNGQSLAAIQEQAESQFPEAGWSIRDRDRAAPSLTRNVDRFSQFLTLVGLTALVVGGVGVANAVRAYLDGKRGVIATLKCLGASGRLVLLIYLFQIGMIALIGIVAGLIIGALAPLLAHVFLADFLPVSDEFQFYPGALGIAAFFGAVTTLLFALLPLGRARDIPPTALFREQGFALAGWPRWPYLAVSCALALILAATAILFSDDRFIATIFVVAIVLTFLLLRVVAVFVAWLARSAPQTASTPLRLAIGNIHRPGALTASVVLSLGLGLALLVAVALIDGNLRRQVAGDLTRNAPDFFFVDIQNDTVGPFSDLLENRVPGAALERVPMLRGRIVELNNVPLSEMTLPTEGRWVLRGDRGLTYSDTIPDNATLAGGEWWPSGYDGEPLVSFSAEEAGEIGLAVGDTVTVNVLGRNITARIANLREVEWESLSINFVMVFSPNTFAGAPHSWLATLSLDDAGDVSEADILREITNAFPAVTSIRVKDALDTVNSLIAQLANAIRAAAGVALVASVLVLAGALAAGNHARLRDAVILKTLGATRRILITAFGLEYFLLGLATALFAIAAGGIAAWFVVSRIMELPSAFLPGVAVSTLVLALFGTIGIGLTGTWRILGRKVGPVLRDP